MPITKNNSQGDILNLDSLITAELNYCYPELIKLGDWNKQLDSMRSELKIKLNKFKIKYNKKSMTNKINLEVIQVIIHPVVYYSCVDFTANVVISSCA